MKYELPRLPYRYDALEPYIDAKTMEIHYSKHHQAYVNNLNAALDKFPQFAAQFAATPLEDILKSLESFPPEFGKAVRNHGGGHYNHSFFWNIMAPQAGGGGGEPKELFGQAMKRYFGDFKKFREDFSRAAAGVFGSGWAWLVIEDKAGKKELKIVTTPNQDNPISQGLAPILGLDVWEHAYYLLYQNRRPDYITAWWSVVNWEEVGKNWEKATG